MLSAKKVHYPPDKNTAKHNISFGNHDIHTISVTEPEGDIIIVINFILPVIGYAGERKERNKLRYFP